MQQQEKVYLITSTAEAGTMETLPVVPEMELIRNEDLECSDIRFGVHQKVCVTSEYSLATVAGRLDPARKNAVTALKDKFRFREILRGIHPGYGYRLLTSEEIGTLTVDKKSVIKPVRGCFGTAVRVVGPETDFPSLAPELDGEILKNSKVYPDSVLATNEFILEDFIGGEEYAVDMFYDSAGIPRIVNILHHPAPANSAYVHMLYNSSKEAFDAVYEKAIQFFVRLNELLRVTNFVMHSELRLWNGVLFPVEINTMRFGGMGLCNLVHFSFGINPFICFLKDEEPDWNSLWAGKEEKVYSYLIAYNGAGIRPDECRPRPDLLKQRFTTVLREQPFDHRLQLAFGVYFLEETKENVRNLLNLEFDDYFEPL